MLCLSMNDAATTVPSTMKPAPKRSLIYMTETDDWCGP